MQLNIQCIVEKSMDVEECDATGVDYSKTAGQIKIRNIICSLYSTAATMKYIRIIQAFFIKRSSRCKPISEAVSEGFKDGFKEMGYSEKNK